MSASNRSSEPARRSSYPARSSQGAACLSSVQEPGQPLGLRAAAALITAGQQAPRFQRRRRLDLGRRPLRPWPAAVHGDFGLDDGAAHGGMGQPVGADAQRDQPGPGSDEAVGVPVGQQPAAFISSWSTQGCGSNARCPARKGRKASGQPTGQSIPVMSLEPNSRTISSSPTWRARAPGGRCRRPIQGRPQPSSGWPRRGPRRGSSLRPRGGRDRGMESTAIGLRPRGTAVPRTVLRGCRGRPRRQSGPRRRGGPGPWALISSHESPASSPAPARSAVAEQQRQVDRVRGAVDVPRRRPGARSCRPCRPPGRAGGEFPGGPAVDRLCTAQLMARTTAAPSRGRWPGGESPVARQEQPGFVGGGADQDLDPGGRGVEAVRCRIPAAAGHARTGCRTAWPRSARTSGRPVTRAPRSPRRPSPGCVR